MLIFLRILAKQEVKPEQVSTSQLNKMQHYDVALGAAAQPAGWDSQLNPLSATVRARPSTCSVTVQSQLRALT